MCVECEREVDEMRPALDYLLDAERNTRKVFGGDTEAQHAIRLACTVIDSFHSTGHDIRALCLSFSLVVQKLLALQEVTGAPQ